MAILHPSNHVLILLGCSRYGDVTSESCFPLCAITSWATTGPSLWPSLQRESSDFLQELLNQTYNRVSKSWWLWIVSADPYGITFSGLTRLSWPQVGSILRQVLVQVQIPLLSRLEVHRSAAPIRVVALGWSWLSLTGNDNHDSHALSSTKQVCDWTPCHKPTNILMLIIFS